MGMSTGHTRAMRRVVALLLVAFSLVAPPLTAQAPPAPPGPEPASGAAATSRSSVVERLSTRYRFEHDGSGTRTLQAQVLLRDAAALADWGELGFDYMAATESVSLRELTIVKADGRRVSVSDAPLQDVTRSGQVDEPTVSDWRAKRITVPSLAPGDRMVYDVEIRSRASLIPGHFWIDHWFTRDGSVADETLEIDVPAERALRVVSRRGEDVRDPGAPAGRMVRRWRLRADPPPALDETAARRLMRAELEAGPDVRVSSFDSWTQLSEWFAATVERSAVVDAAIRAKADSLVQGRGTPRARLEALYDFVSADVRYVSLAFGAGRFEPRPASLVLSTQYGDCKDKHTLLASLAAAVGLTVRPVLISSVTDLNERVPTPAEFDHVISFAEIGPAAADRVWMDSTPGVAPAGALASRLRGRRAVLASTGAAASSSPIVKTPEALPTPSAHHVEIAGRIAESGGITATVTRRLIGDPEYLARRVFRSADAAARESILKAQMAEDGLKDGTPRNPSMKDEGPGRGVTYTYEVTRALSLDAPKAWTFWPPAPRVFAMGDDGDGEAPTRPLDLGGPAVNSVTLRYVVPATFRARTPVDVELDRPFASYRSRYTAAAGSITVERRLEAKLREVAPADWPAFVAFRRAVDADYRQTFAVDAILDAPAATPVTADEHVIAGRRATDARDYPRAIALLQKATTLDATHKTAWVNLGYAYRSAQRHAEALGAFERQVAVDPYQKYAYAYLGATLWSLGRPDEAIAQFRKQIEISPLDDWAHAQLGRLYHERKRYAEAVTSLERAVSITSNDADLWSLLGRARLELDQREPALAAFERAAAGSATPQMFNEMAWQLVVKGVALDKARAYSQASIDGVMAKLRDVRLETATAANVRSLQSLASYWDTMGWIRYKAGDPVAAEAYLRAAWAMIQDSEVGEHLAEVAERAGRREQAIDLYARATAATPPRASARAAIDRLVGAERATTLVLGAREALVKERTTTLSRLVEGRAAGEVLLRIGGDGVISGVRVTRGDERLRAAAGSLTGQRTTAVIPDSPAGALIRAGLVNCTESGCALVLLLPADTPAIPK
jgi:tetratricopeptide (TPR) repeat protein